MSKRFTTIEVEKPSRRWILPAVAAVVSAAALAICAYNIDWKVVDHYYQQAK